MDKASRLARKPNNRAATKTITAIALVSAIVVGVVGIWVLTMSNVAPVPSQEIQKPKEVEVIKEVPKSHLVVWGVIKGPISKELPPVELPQTFNMTIVPNKDRMNLFEYSFGTVLQAKEKVKISMNATSPINFQIRFSDYLPKAGQRVYEGRETIIDKKAITTFDYELNVERSGSYLFEFASGTPEPIETRVTFDAYRLGR